MSALKASTTSLGFGQAIVRMLESQPGQIKKMILSPPKYQKEEGWRIDLVSNPGVDARIERSVDLAHWHWLGSEQLSGDSASFLDPQTDLSAAFYRVWLDGSLAPGVTGYARREIPHGLSMLSVPLQSPGATFNQIFLKPSEGFTVSKFNLSGLTLTPNVYKWGAWARPMDTLAPGEGAVCFNPGLESVVMMVSGEVAAPRSQVIPAGFSLCAPILPLAGGLRTQLRFPFEEGDVVHLYDRLEKRYRVCAYPSQEWSLDEPSIDLGEAFWVTKQSEGVWQWDGGLEAGFFGGSGGGSARVAPALAAI
jgi:hypothetical protein